MLDAGYDPNFMLHPWIRRSYDDERKSALFFAVSNNDMASVKLLLEAGAMPNQDPVKCLQVKPVQVKNKNTLMKRHIHWKSEVTNKRTKNDHCLKFNQTKLCFF